mmetsp:Transcript_7810/g.22308  ORF Transcript_7810/g.22308 Transcript_7810/m.22308 type:complete len:232 (+) Transcript_7810:781-1476(+)
MPLPAIGGAAASLPQGHPRARHRGTQDGRPPRWRRRRGACAAQPWCRGVRGRRGPDRCRQARRNGLLSSCHCGGGGVRRRARGDQFPPLRHGPARAEAQGRGRGRCRYNGVAARAQPGLRHGGREVAEQLPRRTQAARAHGDARGVRGLVRRGARPRAAHAAPARRAGDGDAVVAARARRLLGHRRLLGGIRPTTPRRQPSRGDPALGGHRARSPSSGRCRRCAIRVVTRP